MCRKRMRACAPIAHFIFNSMLVTGLTDLCALLLNSMSGFSFFRFKTAWGEVMAYPNIFTGPALAVYLALQRTCIASTGVTG